MTTITNTEPTTAQYNSRAEAAEKLHDRALTMLHQSVETLARAMQAHGVNITIDGVSSAPTPQLGISKAADRCHAAETSLEALANGILLDLQGAIDNAERPLSFPELEVDGEHETLGCLAP